MAWSDMRAVTVTGATLAFLGCCLFVMHSENASFQGIREGATVLPDSLEKAAEKAGEEAKATKVTVSKVTGGDANTVVSETVLQSSTTATTATAAKTWVPVGHMQINCLTTKGFAYSVKDELLDLGFQDLGVTYDLLMALSPGTSPTDKDESPKDCVKQFDAFMAAAGSKYMTGSLPEMQLSAIKASMMADGGILITLNEDGTHIVTLDGAKLGLGNVNAGVGVAVGVKANQAEVFRQLKTMSKGANAANALTSSIKNEVGIDRATAEEMAKWNGKEE